jgi:hypothetical protein
MPLLFISGLQVFQSLIKLRVEIALQKSELQTITLPANAVHWYEEGREILIHGKMFDIKTYSITDGIFTAQGIFDDQETEVVKLLGHFGEKEQAMCIIKLLVLSQTLFGITIFSFFYSFVEIKQPSFPGIFLTYLDPYLNFMKPPPWPFSFFRQLRF